MIYIEFIAPAPNEFGAYNNIVPRPEKWTRDLFVKTLEEFLGEDMTFRLKRGQHLANETEGEPETMEDGYFLIDPQTSKIMAWMSQGALDLLRSEKFIDFTSK